MADIAAKNSLKRPRPVISCLSCRRKKLKCDRSLPCQQCVKTGRSDSCSYQPGQEPETRVTGGNEPAEKRNRTQSPSRIHDNPLGPHPLSSSQAEPPTAVSKSSSRPFAGNGLFEQLEQRVTALESIVGASRSHDAPSQRAQSGSGDHEAQTPLSMRTPAPSRPRQSMPEKVFAHAAAFISSWLNQDENCTQRAQKVAADLRQLHDSLKFVHRRPVNVHAPLSKPQILRLIPSQPVCAVLTELYFDNLEHCFRILHRPTFDRQLNEFFAGDDSNQQHEFLPQLVAVLAIASILGVRQECVNVDGQLINTSVEYIHSYMSSLNAKEARTIPALQTRMILLLLRWMRLDRLGDLWELSGQILRQALTMGMDTDPSENPRPVSILEAELRRRLWMTACEQDMMLSILCNMPCLIPDFTCRVPLNVNDSELLEGTDSVPVSRPFDVWTDTLCQCYLAQSIQQRLHGCHDMQSASREGYDHVLEHTRSFEQYLQNLPAPLRFNHHGDAANKAPARLMARMELDITMRRPLMQLYSPFFYANDEADVFSEARAGFLQSCLMLTSYQDLFDPKYSDIGVERPQGYWDFFYNVYRHELNQAVLGLCLEIQRLSSSSQPNNPVANHTFSAFRMPTYTKSTLIHSVRDTYEPMIRRISHLGSNLKDLAYLIVVFSSVHSAQYDPGAITEDLEDLVASCKTQMERDAIPLVQTQSDTADSQPWTPTFDLDAAWMTFPQVPAGFDDFGGIDFNFDII